MAVVTVRRSALTTTKRQSLNLPRQAHTTTDLPRQAHATTDLPRQAHVSFTQAMTSEATARQTALTTTLPSTPVLGAEEAEERRATRWRRSHSKAIPSWVTVRFLVFARVQHVVLLLSVRWQLLLLRQRSTHAHQRTSFLSRFYRRFYRVFILVFIAFFSRGMCVAAGGGHVAPMMHQSSPVPGEGNTLSLSFFSKTHIWTSGDHRNKTTMHVCQDRLGTNN